MMNSGQSGTQILLGCSDRKNCRTSKNKREGFTERTRKRRNTGTDSSDFRIILCLRNDIAFR